MSLRLRLLLTLVPLFVIGLVAADIATYAALQSYLTARVDQQAIQAHVPIERSLLGSTAGGGGPSGGGQGGGGDSGPFPQGTYGELRSASGEVLKAQNFTFSTDTNTHPVLPRDLKPGDQAHPTLVTVPGAGSISSYRVYVDAANDGSGDIIIAAVPLSDLQATLGQLLGLELGVSAAVTLVLTLLAMIIVRRSLRPLARMGDTARSIVAQGLNQRVSPATERTEVGRLGLALNEMLSELESAFASRAASQERLKQFVSDASHELRTPLTSMRGYAELLRRNEDMEREEVLTAARRIEDEAARMGVLVDDLLLLARLDQGRALQRNRVDLEGLVSDATADARVADPARRISARVLAPLVIDGDELRLRQVLGNIIRNALVHTPAGTPIEVALHAEPGLAVIEVVDHGPGIAEADAGRIFERFHRADPNRSRDRGGSGLGLSIAGAIVDAHRGSISVVPTSGGGATFRIELPLDAPPPGEEEIPSQL
ncbi:MAG: two-component system, OmpR family, sensor kinase [Chloroflexota bacterium]|jgi:two-component system OmpR family sensor kinase|nr:two-component system, OmpR family, sensor kinase [Chloroflexota bacterium]